MIGVLHSRWWTRRLGASQVFSRYLALSLRWILVGALLASGSVKLVGDWPYRFDGLASLPWLVALDWALALALMIRTSRIGALLLAIASAAAIVYSYIGGHAPCGCFGGDVVVSPRARRIVAGLAGLAAIAVWCTTKGPVAEAGSREEI